MSQESKTELSARDAENLESFYGERAAYDSAEQQKSQLKMAESNLDDVPFVTSLPYVTPQDRIKALSHRMTMGNGISLLKQKDGFMVKDFVLFHASYTSAEGEDVAGPVMILISPDGSSARVSSKLLIKQIIGFIREFGNPPYNPPVNMRASDVVLQNGNRTYQLHVSLE